MLWQKNVFQSCFRLGCMHTLGRFLTHPQPTRDSRVVFTYTVHVIQLQETNTPEKIWDYRTPCTCTMATVVKCTTAWTLWNRAVMSWGDPLLYTTDKVKTRWGGTYTYTNMYIQPVTHYIKGRQASPMLKKGWSWLMHVIRGSVQGITIFSCDRKWLQQVLTWQWFLLQMP